MIEPITITSLIETRKNNEIIWFVAIIFAIGLFMWIREHYVYGAAIRKKSSDVAFLIV